MDDAIVDEFFAFLFFAKKQRKFQNLCNSKHENFNNKNHIIILHFIVVNFKEFIDTHFMNDEMFEKSNFHEENVQIIVIFKAKFPKMVNFKEYFSLLS